MAYGHTRVFVLSRVPTPPQRSPPSSHEAARGEEEADAQGQGGEEASERSREGGEGGEGSDHRERRRAARRRRRCRHGGRGRDPRRRARGRETRGEGSVDERRRRSRRARAQGPSPARAQAQDRGAEARSSHTGPRTTASARCTPFLEDFISRRISPPITPRFRSRHTSLDAFELRF